MIRTPGLCLALLALCSLPVVGVTAEEDAPRMSAKTFASDEAAEGMAAFREKRQASWVTPG